MRNYYQNPAEVTKSIMQIWPERDEYIIAGVRSRMLISSWIDSEPEAVLWKTFSVCQF